MKSIKCIGGQSGNNKIVLADIITPQSRPLDILITALHELHIRNISGMVDKISNIQLSDLRSKPHGVQSLRDIIDREVGVRLYSPPGSEHYKLLFLNRFHKSTHH